MGKTRFLSYLNKALTCGPIAKHFQCYKLRSPRLVYEAELHVLITFRKGQQPRKLLPIKQAEKYVFLSYYRRTHEIYRSLPFLTHTYYSK